MSLRINLRHLTAALEIRRLGSISRATEAVHLSQSAITQGIGKLEGELGFALFNRSHEGLAATEAGEIFLQRAQSAISFLARMDQLPGRKANPGAAPLYRSLTVSQLRAVMTVVDERSYTLAARRLQLSQPTVHRAVQEAENVCGQTLFSKSPAGLEPSWYARHLARCISLFFVELSQGIDEVEEHRGRITGQLRIGSLPLARTRGSDRVAAITDNFYSLPAADRAE